MVYPSGLARDNWSLYHYSSIFHAYHHVINMSYVYSFFTKLLLNLPSEEKNTKITLLVPAIFYLFSLLITIFYVSITTVIEIVGAFGGFTSA